MYQPEMTRAQGDFYSAVGRLDGLDDPVLLEVVRIRCARTHDCRMCRASRYLPAQEAGLDEASLAAVDRFESSALPERLKVALRYTDVFLTRPGDMSPELHRDLGAHFTEAEMVFLSLEIAKFSIQKQLITLGIDVLPGMDMDREVAWFQYDASGQIEYLGSPEPIAT
jgi:alkylhydroperoxidase family enzyme